MTPSDDQSRKEVSSRADLRLEHLVDELQRTLASLAISLRTLRRSPGNMVFKMSAEQQYHAGKLQLAAVLSFPSVAYSDDVAKIAEGAVAPFLELCSQFDWLPLASDLREICQTCADVLFEPSRIHHDGRPCKTFEALLARHAKIPHHEQPAVVASAQPKVLHERTFTHAQGTVSHEAFIGELYVAFLQHVKGLSPEDVKTHLTPAGLTGFAQSLEKALQGYSGVVTFRIVREGDAAKVVIHRATAHH